MESFMLLEHIRFKNRQSLRIEVGTYDNLPQALDKLGLENPCPVMVVVGGAGGVQDKDQAAIRQVIELIAQVAQTLGAVVVDGGTRSGIIETMGQTRSQNAYQFPLVGVCAVDTVTWPGRSGGFWQRFRDQRAPLDTNHTHFILVPGENWGDESIWISEVATQMAGKRPSVAILINGGQIARDQDIPNNLKAGRKVLVIEGTGRVADELATLPPDTTLMQLIHISEPDRLFKKLNQHLQSGA
jgi:hypothetical protein